jgi:hypothetical protein
MHFNTNNIKVCNGNSGAINFAVITLTFCLLDQLIILTNDRPDSPTNEGAVLPKYNYAKLPMQFYKI